MEATTLDDLSAAIGYTATCKLRVWYGGRNLHVPLRADAEHPLATIVGLPALRALVREFASYGSIWIPADGDLDRYRRMRDVAERLARGETPESIAKLLRLSPAMIRRIRAEAVAEGWLAYAQRGVADGRRRQGQPLRSVVAAENFRTNGVFQNPPPPTE